MTDKEDLLDEMLTLAGRVIKAENMARKVEEENNYLRRHIDDLIADIPKSPYECYRCGSCDVTSQWFMHGRTSSPGLGHQPSRIIVWYCAKHEPRSTESE